MSSFGVMNLSHKRAIRMPPNPLDKATIVSILPIDIVERKPTIQPGIFTIKKGSYDNPSILTVGTSSWWRDAGDESPILEIPVSSILVADSVIRDYCNGLVGCNMSDLMPGLFFIPGELTIATIKKDHKERLDRARDNQKRWYESLITIADTLWARSNGNPLSISNEARLAAEELGYKDKPWMGDFRIAQLSNCPACGQMRNSNYPVCPNCKNVVDVEKAKTLGLKFVS